MTRQLQRQKVRKRRKEGEKAVQNGLALEPDSDTLLGLAVVIRDCLTDATQPARAGGAAEIIHRVNEVSQRKARDRVAVACSKGCASCCHTVVSVLPPEVFRIVRALRSDDRLRAQIPALLERIALTAEKTHDERRGRKLPCALLQDGLCSVYAARPSTCRKTASTALADCLAVFEGGSKGWTSPRINDVAASASLYAMSIALAAEGLDWHSYELSAALRVALLHDDAEAAWLAGNDIFAGLRRDPRPAGFERSVMAAAAEISG